MTCKELGKVRNLICKHPLCVKTGKGGQRWHIIDKVFRIQLETKEAPPIKRIEDLDIVCIHPKDPEDEAYTILCQDRFSIRLSENELRRLADKEVVKSRNSRGDEIILSVITAIRDGSLMKGVFDTKSFDEKLSMLGKKVTLRHCITELSKALDDLMKEI